MAAPIHIARQAKADTEREIHELKSEARKLLETPAARRVPAQTARLDAIDVALEAKNTALGATLKEIQQLERYADDERKMGSQPDVPIVRGRGRKWAEMFSSVPLSSGGFGSNQRSASEDFLATIHAGLSDPRLLATSTTMVDSSGGYSVPTEVRAQWMDASLENEIVRPRADVWPMASSSIQAPGFDDGDHSDDLYGGLVGGWANEGDDLDLEEVKLRMITLKARKLGILTRVSNELIADGVSFDAQLGTAIVKAIGWFLDRAFLIGNGANQPLGIHNSAATITVTKETGQGPASIIYANLANMFARLLPGSLDKAVWVANPTTIPMLLQLGVSIGTGGSHVPVLSESGGKFTILTRPCIFSEKVPALGTRGDIGLYDFSAYVVGMRQEMTLAKSMHAGFQSDTSYYRGILRADGQAKLSAPVQPYLGSTQSPFVLLETRA